VTLHDLRLACEAGNGENQMGEICKVYKVLMRSGESYRRAGGLNAVLALRSFNDTFNKATLSL